MGSTETGKRSEVLLRHFKQVETLPLASFPIGNILIKLSSSFAREHSRRGQTKSRAIKLFGRVGLGASQNLRMMPLP